MTEPVHEVNIAQVLQILGAKEVEIQMQRGQIAQLQAKLKEAEASGREKKPAKAKA